MSKLAFPHLAARLTARLSTVPTAAAGLALGLASLGWCADQLFQQQGKVQLAAALLALPLLLAVVLKFLSAPRLLQQELAHPVAGSLLPVICMATLVQSAALQQIAAAPATALWWLALIAHLSLLAGFIRHRLAHFALTDLVPAWFIPPIGFVVGGAECTGHCAAVATADLGRRRLSGLFADVTADAVPPAPRQSATGTATAAAGYSGCTRQPDVKWPALPAAGNDANPCFIAVKCHRVSADVTRLVATAKAAQWQLQPGLCCLYFPAGD